jgi:hypothetical protein
MVFMGTTDRRAVLLGGCGLGPPQDQHNLLPVMKLGDFGSALVIDGAFLSHR